MDKFVEYNEFDTLNAIADNIPIGLWRTDSKCNLLYANLAVEQIFGRQFKELVNKKFLRFIHNDDEKRCEDSMCKNEKPSHVRIMQNDGNVRYLKIQSTKLDAGGFVGTMTDITGPKIALPKLLKIKDELKNTAMVNIKKD